MMNDEDSASPDDQNFTARAPKIGKLDTPSIDNRNHSASLLQTVQKGHKSSTLSTVGKKTSSAVEHVPNSCPEEGKESILSIKVSKDCPENKNYVTATEGESTTFIDREEFNSVDKREHVVPLYIGHTKRESDGVTLNQSAFVDSNCDCNCSSGDGSKLNENLAENGESNQTSPKNVSSMNILPFCNLLGKLKHLPRTGWLKYKLTQHPESVAGHMYRMAILAFCLDDHMTSCDGNSKHDANPFALLDRMVKIIEEKLNDKFPSIDDEIKSYILSIIDENRGEFTGADDIYDAIGDILVSASGESESSQVDEFCRELTKILNISKKVDGDKSSKVGDRRLLIGPVSFSVENAEKEDDSGEANLWNMSRNTFSNSDVKKLEKAESKMKNKQEKKIQNSSSSTKLAPEKDCLASVNQPTNNSSSYSDFCTDIKLENFDMFFGDRKLLVDANMTLVFGRRYGLVGRNGLGKTTLLKMISTGNLKIPSRLTLLHVEQEVNGDDTIVLDSVLESDEKRHNLLSREKEIQRKLNSHEDHKSEADQKQLAEELHDIYEKLTSIEADKAPARAASILVGLGFDFDAQKRHTKEFSGGWRMRLALARALFMQPDLLLLDEPTNMLDIKAIYWLENYLQNWKTTMLVVSHDRNFLNKISTDIILLRNQRLDHYSGDYDNFEKARAEKLKNELREYEAQKQLREHVQIFIDRFRYNANRAALVQSKIKMLEKLPVLKPIETDADVKFDFPASERINATVLQLDEITFAYDPKDKSTLIFEKCDLNADADSRICIVGENGAGKTTLLKLLNGELEPTSGFRRPHRTLKIAYFTQHHVDQLLYDQNALQFIQTKFHGQTVENYRAALGRFGISGDLVFQPIASLSGGQKSRLAFSLICMQAPNFLILDEPTNHLDIESVEALGAALQKFEGGVILVSHDERLIELVCKELWLVKNKNVKRIEGGLKEYKKIIEQELAEMR